ncbi:MAG TPA: ETC complex I subunit [Patescibacteria group bacterium]|nr:ETC complex I subunit [Patescibacteria group bacterium]
MPQVRIYRPAKNTMQSGRANSRRWLVEFEPSDRREPDALMGWNGSGDTRAQLRLKFDTKEEAIAYAEREGLTYTVIEPRKVNLPKPKNYADNFKFDKVA